MNRYQKACYIRAKLERGRRLKHSSNTSWTTKPKETLIKTYKFFKIIYKNKSMSAISEDCKGIRAYLINN